MDESDDEEYVFYGTALDPIEEDEIVRKRPITVEEMQATDKQGRRRFHGAFTGGFSAGFYNTVGSLEGWKPSTFKSSRSERAKFASQTPDDFMDDEDTDEFGIAPKALQARPEYGGGRKRQREVDLAFHSGPIPGVPVLKSILEPAKETIGMLLLIKMGWRPGQGVGPKLTRLQRRLTRASRAKIYSCAPQQDDSSSDDSCDELVSPEDLPGSEKPTPKEDSSGLGYVGLSRPDISASEPKAFTFIDSKNRRLAISGQAFGVGAFEEEDDCIYSVDDKSNYDFSLEPISSGRKKSRFSDKDKPLAITDGSNVLPGFIEAKEVIKKKYFPPPELPPGYIPTHQAKISRFEPSSVPVPKGPKVHLDAASREAIIDPTVRIKSVPDVPESTVPLPEAGWLPFSSDPEKQERYEKYLRYIKIGAKDAVKHIQPHTMTDLERERELSEFAAAATLYKPLAGFLRERFTHGGVKEEVDIKTEEATKVEKLTITTESWYPHDLLCKRFNIPNPHGSRGEMLNEAKQTKERKKFNLFDFLAKPPDEESESTEAPSASVETVEPEQSSPTDEQENTTVIQNEPAELLVEDPPNKMDLYKAIFESSDEEEQEDEALPPAPVEPSKNPLRNTSPPRGIFANLDLDELNRRASDARATESTENPKDAEPAANSLPNLSPPRGIFGAMDLDELKEKSKSSENHAENSTGKSEKSKIHEDINPADLYGPVLPSKPLFTKTYQNVKLDVDDGMWVEKSSDDKSKHKHKHKKHKKESKKKKEKQKRKKKSKYSDSD